MTYELLFYTHTHAHTQWHADMVRPACAGFYLCLENCIRNRQCSAVVCDPALTLCCSILCVLVMHHSRNHMIYGSVHRKASPASHSSCLSPETLCFHAVCCSDSLFEKGSSLSSCSYKSQCGRDGV